jgi:hypothetical protein
MNEETIDKIVYWWVNFTDKVYLKQDSGDRGVNKVTTLNRLECELLTEAERDLFKASLTSVIKSQSKSFELFVDYKAKDLLLEALNLCGETGCKIDGLLPIKTTLNYNYQTNTILARQGYNGEWIKL